MPTTATGPDIPHRRDGPYHRHVSDPPNTAPGAAGNPVPNPAQVERWLLCDLMTEVGFL